MLTKVDLNNVLNLSCVERYFLAWLNKYYDIKKLYNNSYITIPKVFDDFLNGATYENYNEIERIQDNAEKNNIIIHSFIHIEAHEALRIIKELKDDELCLIQVSTNFLKKYKRQALRFDHYICINRDLEWLNEYPLSSGKYLIDEFLEIFSNKILIFKLNNLDNVPNNQNNENIINQKMKENINYPKDLLRLESAIGVLRISRKRLENFYMDNPKISLLFKDESQILDKLYFQIHFKMIKKQCLNFIDFEKELYNLLNYEKKVIEVIKNEER